MKQLTYQMLIDAGYSEEVVASNWPCIKDRHKDITGYELVRVGDFYRPDDIWFDFRTPVNRSSKKNLGAGNFAIRKERLGSDSSSV